MIEDDNTSIHQCYKAQACVALYLQGFAGSGKKEEVEGTHLHYEWCSVKGNNNVL